MTNNGLHQAIERGLGDFGALVCAGGLVIVEEGSSITIYHPEMGPPTLEWEGEVSDQLFSALLADSPAPLAYSAYAVNYPADTPLRRQSNILSQMLCSFSHSAFAKESLSPSPIRGGAPGLGSVDQ